jgi:hypothetical protein
MADGVAWLARAGPDVRQAQAKGQSLSLASSALPRPARSIPRGFFCSGGSRIRPLVRAPWHRFMRGEGFPLRHGWRWCCAFLRAMAGGGGANQRAPWHLEMRGAKRKLPILAPSVAPFPTRGFRRRPNLFWLRAESSRGRGIRRAPLERAPTIFPGNREPIALAIGGTAFRRASVTLRSLPAWGSRPPQKPISLKRPTKRQRSNPYGNQDRTPFDG